MEYIFKQKFSAFFVAAIVALMGIFGMAALSAVPAGAQIGNTACQGFQDALGESCDDGSAEGRINNTIETAIDIISIVVGVISVIMIIIGGIRYVTSQGDPGSTKGARDTIIYAVIGLVIVAISQFIVKFVVRQITD